MSAYVVDVILDGTGSVALLGPFRSEQRAHALCARIEAICEANAVRDYRVDISEVYPASEWFEHIDLKPFSP